MIDVEKNIKEFEELYTQYILPRDGADKLLEFIRKSDFYTAPASTKYHLAKKGGLLQHSLNVWHCLIAKADSETWRDIVLKAGWEKLATISLLHDLCKTYMYTIDYKNQKVYDEDLVKTANPKNVKHDSKGDFIWLELPTYVVNNKFPLGHGAKTVFMIQQFMKLSMEEIACIYWHMGAYGLNDKDCNELGSAIEKYPLVLALQEADMEASHLLEVNC